MHKLVGATCLVACVSALTPAQAASGMTMGNLTPERMVTMVQKRPPPPAAPPGTVFPNPVNPGAGPVVRDHRGEKPRGHVVVVDGVPQRVNRPNFSRPCMRGQPCPPLPRVRDHRGQPPEDRHR